MTTSGFSAKQCASSMCITAMLVIALVVTSFPMAAAYTEAPAPGAVMAMTFMNYAVQEEVYEGEAAPEGEMGIEGERGEGESVEGETIESAPPIPRVPEEHAEIVGATVTLRWYLVSDATGYGVQVAHDADFLALVVDESTASEQFELDNLPQDGTVIYWRVRAKNGVESGWSAPQSFTSLPVETEEGEEELPLPAPLLQSPAQDDEIDNATVLLRWYMVPDATGYRVQVAHDADFLALVADSSADSEQFQLDNLPQDGTVVYWRVRTLNGALGSWSEAWSFVSVPEVVPEGEGEDEGEKEGEDEGEGEAPLVAPVLDTPEDEAVLADAEVTLRWFLVEGAESYQVQVARDEAFQKIEHSELVTGNFYSVTDLPRDGSMFYWHARAHQMYSSIWSETRRFTSVSSAPEGVIRAWLSDIPWSTYATVSGIVLLALGILWVAEDPPSPCMVATAAYGTPMASQIAVLRLVRDQYLLDSLVGTVLVDVYYRTGGWAATYVEHNAWAAWAVRMLLRPALGIAAFLLLFPRVLTITGGAVAVLALFALLFWLRRQRRDTSQHAPCGADMP